MHSSEDTPAGAPPFRITAPAPLTSSEDVAEFEATWKQFAAQFEPRGIVEQTLVYHAATIAWRLRRLPYIESALAETLFDSRSASRELEFLSRHETRLFRIFNQILRGLGVRPRDPAPPDSRASAPKNAPPPEAPPPAPPSDFSYHAGPASPPPLLFHPALVSPDRRGSPRSASHRHDSPREPSRPRAPVPES